MFMEKEFIDLLTLQTMLQEGVEEIFPERIWVRAEVSSIGRKSNGHCYLELSQTENGTTVAKAKAVIWRSRYQEIAGAFENATGTMLREGISLLAKVQVSYSVLYGLTLTIDEIEPEFTIGVKELERRRTIEKLKAEGLLEKQQELELTDLPYALAVISAKDAAGYGDFRRHLLENEYGFAFRVDLFEATMQGVTAPESIVDALDEIEASGTGYDAVLIMRGGGSNLDMDCFDDYGLAFRIANCCLPVFTAIGHDRDHHVADMVAFRSVKTPTALADAFLECDMAEDERIGSYATRLRLAFAGKINAMESRVELLCSRIKAADPRNILTRGYALAVDAKGVVLKSVKGVNAGDKVDVMFADGKLNCTVNGKV